MDSTTLLGIANIVVMVGLVLLTAWYAKSTKELVEATRAVPSVIVDVEFERGWLIFVVIRNVGNAVAKDVAVRCPPSVVNSSGHHLADLEIFQRGIPYLAPGREIRHFFDGAAGFYGRTGTTQQWDFQVTYSDVSGKHLTSHEFGVDLSVYRGLAFTAVRTLSDVYDELKSIDGTLSKMVSIFPKGVRIVTKQEVDKAWGALERATQTQSAQQDAGKEPDASSGTSMADADVDLNEDKGKDAS